MVLILFPLHLAEESVSLLVFGFVILKQKLNRGKLVII